MFYTIVPLELLFQNDPAFEASPHERLVSLLYKGKHVLVRQVRDALVIDRLISTDPKDYLDASLQPGQIVGYYPDFLKPPR